MRAITKLYLAKYKSTGDPQNQFKKNAKIRRHTLPFKKEFFILSFFFYFWKTAFFTRII